MKVYAPNKSFNGNRAGVQFSDGTAEVEDDSPAMRYFRAAGYGLGEEPSRDEAAEPADPRDIARTGPHRVGTRLRDAAVDPKPEDFLPPTNAGKANPHGRAVVAPEIHASGPAGVRPGEVHVDDTDAQQAAETALAEAVLVNNEPHPSQDEDEDRGPLEISDPGSVEAGQENAGDADEGGIPAKNASHAAWVDYAEAQGMSRDEAEAMTRADLIERHGG